MKNSKPGYLKAHVHPAEIENSAKIEIHAIRLLR